MLYIVSSFFFPYHWLLLYTLKLAGIFIILQKKWFFSTLPSPEDKAQQTLREIRTALCADSSGIPVVKPSSISVLVLFYFLDKQDPWSLFKLEHLSPVFLWDFLPEILVGLSYTEMPAVCRPLTTYCSHLSPFYRWLPNFQKLTSLLHVAH